MLSVKVVKADATATMEAAADLNDAGISGKAKRGEEQAGEGKVAKVVDAKLRLETIGGELSFGRSQNSGIIDQQVDGTLTKLDAAGKAEWSRGRQGRVSQTGPKRGERGNGFCRRRHGHGHRCDRR